MKYQVGDRVRINTSQWNHLQLHKSTGTIVRIYSLKEYGFADSAYRIAIDDSDISISCAVENENYLERIENE